MNATDIIDKLPFEFAARLQCDPFFKNIPVVVAEKGNVALEYARQQAVITEANGRRGVAVIVLQLLADDLSNNLAFGPMTLKPAFQVIENVELNNDDNGTKLSARKVARRIRDVIKGCNLMGLVQDMRTGKPCIEPTELKDLADSIVGYQVNFECLEVSNETILQVQMPTIAAGPSAGAPTFTLACSTPGAAIWYTTDDSFPYNDDGTNIMGSTAALYADPVPFAVQTSVTVRAAAYLDGSIASGVNRFTLIAEPA